MEDHGESENKGSDVIINQDPVQLVFSIQMLLEKILGELDNKSVYNSRFVSRSWNIAVLAIFPKRPIKGQRPRALNLQRLFESWNESPTFDVKLAKSIRFMEFCTGEENCELDPRNSSRTKFLEFWNQYSKHIESVQLKFCQQFATTFSQFMYKFGENLKDLSFQNSCLGFLPETVIPNCEKQLLRMNLHTIDLQDCWEFEETFQAPIQAIISGSTNLTRLKLGKLFYPDLSQNKKLKYLSHKETESFNPEQLSKMLFQVKESLETLKLKTASGEDKLFNGNNFKFPIMPRLKKLTMSDIALHPLQDHFTQTLFDIINLKLPALRALKIRDPKSNCVQNVFEQLMEKGQRGQENIVTLGVENILNPAVLSNFKNWFPNLRKLDLSLSQHIHVWPEPQLISDNFIDWSLSKLTNLRLRQFIFRVDFKFFLTDLVKALIKNVNLFKGLTSFQLHTRKDYDSMVDDLSKFQDLRTKFCEWFVDVTKNANPVVFHGFSFSGETSWELISCIRDRNLPVKFINEELE